MSQKIELSTGGGWLALALLLIAFWGEPDLIDALIEFLTRKI
jgi:hypothetical protein